MTAELWTVEAGCALGVEPIACACTGACVQRILAEHRAVLFHLLAWDLTLIAVERQSWRCEDCQCLNGTHEAFCFRCGAGQPEGLPVARGESGP